jgi:hypothetical protein
MFLSICRSIDSISTPFMSGFAELPHMGSALTGASPGWAEAAEQLVKRVNWDLGNEAVEFSSLAAINPRVPKDDMGVSENGVYPAVITYNFL